MDLCEAKEANLNVQSINVELNDSIRKVSAKKRKVFLTNIKNCFWSCKETKHDPMF